MRNTNEMQYLGYQLSNSWAPEFISTRIGNVEGGFMIATVLFFNTWINREYERSKESNKSYWKSSSFIIQSRRNQKFEQNGPHNYYNYFIFRLTVNYHESRYISYLNIGYHFDIEVR